MKSALIAILLLMCAKSLMCQSQVCSWNGSYGSKLGLDYLKTIGVDILRDPLNKSCCESESFENVIQEEALFYEAQAAEYFKSNFTSNVDAIVKLYAAKNQLDSIESISDEAAEVRDILNNPSLKGFWGLVRPLEDADDLAEFAEEVLAASQRCWPQVKLVREDLLTRFCTPLVVDSRTMKLRPNSFEPSAVKCFALLEDCRDFFRFTSEIYSGQEKIAQDVSQVASPDLELLKSKAEDFYNSIYENLGQRTLHQPAPPEAPAQVKARQCLQSTANRHSGITIGLSQFYLDQNDFLETLIEFVQVAATNTHRNNAHSKIVRLKRKNGSK